MDGVWQHPLTSPLNDSCMLVSHRKCFSTRFPIIGSDLFNGRAQTAWNTIGQYIFSVLLQQHTWLAGGKMGGYLHHLCQPGFVWSKWSFCGVAHRRSLIRWGFAQTGGSNWRLRNMRLINCGQQYKPFLAVDATVTSVSLWRNVTRTWILHHSTPELLCCSFFSGLMPAGSDFLRCVHCPFSKHAHATSVWPRRLYLHNIWRALAVPLM